MIQRIQTLYMLAVAIISGIVPFFAKLYVQGGDSVWAYSTDLCTGVLFGFSSLMAIIAIFGYRKRQNQFVVNRLNILINLTILGIFVYRVLTSSGENAISEKGVGLFLPLFSIVFLFLANKAIMRDERLVKSANRLR